MGAGCSSNVAIKSPEFDHKTGFHCEHCGCHRSDERNAANAFYGSTYLRDAMGRYIADEDLRPGLCYECYDYAVSATMEALLEFRREMIKEGEGNPRKRGGGGRPGYFDGDGSGTPL